MMGSDWAMIGVGAVTAAIILARALVVVMRDVSQDEIDKAAYEDWMNDVGYPRDSDGKPL